MSRWRIEQRQPGPFSLRRDELKAQISEKYGPEGVGWKLAWDYSDSFLDFNQACKVYEEAYFRDSHLRQDLWKKLTSAASDVYDIEPRDVESGLDYRTQKAAGDHLQDIAIRNVLERRGWKFHGKELIQIREPVSYFSRELNPGYVMFHEPERILPPFRPDVSEWWKPQSVEAFYQRNRVVLVPGLKSELLPV